MDAVTEQVSKLMQAQGRKIDELILQAMEKAPNLYMSVALGIEEYRVERPIFFSRYTGSETNDWGFEHRTRVRVVRRDPTWVEFQRRARALREAGVL